MPTVPWTTHHPSGTAFAILKNCTTPGYLNLGNGITIDRLQEPYAIGGEYGYLRSVAEEVGLSADGRHWDFHDAMISETQPAALLSLPAPDVRDPQGDFDNQLRAAKQVCAALSCLTNNPVEILVFVYSYGREAEITFLLKDQLRQIYGHPRYWSYGAAYVTTALEDEHYALLLSLFETAKHAARADFRVFHLAQMIEVAARGYGFEPPKLCDCGHAGPIADAVWEFLDALDLRSCVDDIPTSLSIESISGADPIEVLFQIRNHVAHRGRLEYEKLDAPVRQLIPFPTSIEGLSFQFGTLAENILSRLTWEKSKAIRHRNRY